MDEHHQESTCGRHALSGFSGVHLAVNLYCTSGFALSYMETVMHALTGSNLSEV